MELCFSFSTVLQSMLGAEISEAELCESVVVGSTRHKEFSIPDEIASSFEGRDKRFSIPGEIASSFEGRDSVCILDLELLIHSELCFFPLMRLIFFARRGLSRRNFSW